MLFPAVAACASCAHRFPGRGKRGGARVIYYWWVRQRHCYLVYAYAKNEQSDLTREQLKQLARIMKEETHDG